MSKEIIINTEYFERYREKHPPKQCNRPRLYDAREHRRRRRQEEKAIEKRIEHRRQYCRQYYAEHRDEIIRKRAVAKKKKLMSEYGYDT